MRHHRQQVGLRRQVFAFVKQLFEIGCHFKNMLLALGIQNGIEADIDLGGPVRPDRELMPLFPRKIEQRGQHGCGQRDRNPLDQVKCLANGQAVKHISCALPQACIQLGNFARRDSRSNSLALSVMFRIVHRDEHAQLHVGILHIENDDAAKLPGRRENLRIAFDRDDIVIFCH